MNLMDINICRGFVGWNTYQYSQPFLLEIVLSSDNVTKPTELSLHGEELIGQD